METLSKTVEGERNCLLVVSDLITKSKWFEVTPLPDDLWKIAIKAGDAPVSWTAQMSQKLQSMIDQLDPFQKWMVSCNLATIRGGVPMENQVAILRANGYPNIAAAVEQWWKEEQ